jgi:hypothetical protein
MIVAMSSPSAYLKPAVRDRHLLADMRPGGGDLAG